jgi:D-alanyl-D-alanine carboxypeptidase
MEDVLDLEMEKQERQMRILRSLHLGEMESASGIEEEKGMTKKDTGTGKKQSSEKTHVSAQKKSAGSASARKKSAGQAAHSRRSSKRKARTASPARQCAVLGIFTLLIAGAAILHEANGSLFPASWSENRIRTAWDQSVGSDESGKNADIAGDGTDQSGVTSDAGTENSSFDSLILVNKEYALPENYEVQLHWLNNGQEAVAEQMYDALSAMLTDGSTDGRVYVVASGYRSYERQQELLEEDIQSSMEKYGLTWQEAYDRESQETMPQGHSEHETGLAVDLVALDYQILDAAQEYTEENQWLQEHCQDYGFILRYPRGKEDITGISYESWHFRYVGEEAARKITERGLTLEEYLSE